MCRKGAFHNAYGSRNISNWMNVVINNGSTGYFRGFCGGYSTDWTTLFGHANGYGMNNIWLYAYQTGDQTDVSNFAYSAWTQGFVLNLEKQVFTEWKCTQNSCTSCSYPTEGTWY